MKSNTKSNKTVPLVKVELPSSMSHREKAAFITELRGVAMRQRVAIEFNVPMQSVKVSGAKNKKEMVAVRVEHHSNLLRRKRPYYIASWSQWAVVNAGNARHARQAAVSTFGRGGTCEVRRATQGEVRRYLDHQKEIDDV